MRRTHQQRCSRGGGNWELTPIWSCFRAGDTTGTLAIVLSRRNSFPRRRDLATTGSFDQCGKNDLRHDRIGRSGLRVIGACGENDDEVVLRDEVDLLSAIALGGHSINLLGAGGGFYIQPGTPPEIAIADVVHVTVFGDRCAHPRFGDDLLPVPAAAIR